MKKKIILIPILAIIILVIALLGYFIWDNRTTSIITLDINPSIKINLNKKNEVKKIVAVNKDAEKITKNISLKNKKLDYVIERITDEVEGNNFLTEANLVEIILYTEGNISTNKVKKIISERFNQDNIAADIIVIKNITKEDIKLANKYNINPAKAAYINSITKDKTYIDTKNLINRSIKEIKNTKETGYYCEEGYILDGTRCLKEKKRIKASTGDICPQDYYEYNGICYEMEEGTITNNLKCREDYTLEGKLCVNKQIYDAIAKCEEEYDGGLEKCVKKTYIGEAEEYCRLTPGEDLLYNHRCLGRKPTINGGCLGSDVVIDGWCYDTSPSSGYEADWICNTDNGIEFVDKDGDHKCYKKEYTDPKEYFCEGEGKLQDKKCLLEHKEPPYQERICDEGYTKVDMDICINLNKTADKQNGYICDYPDSHIIDDTCIIYDAIEANNKE